MSSPSLPKYVPLNMPKQVDDNIWIVDGGKMSLKIRNLRCLEKKTLSLTLINLVGRAQLAVAPFVRKTRMTSSSLITRMRLLWID